MEPSLLEFLKKDSNGLLAAVAVVSGAMLLWPYVRRFGGGPSISAAQATQLINREDALVVDVRDPGEYGAGHILGAKNVPLSRTPLRFIAASRRTRIIATAAESDRTASCART